MSKCIHPQHDLGVITLDRQIANHVPAHRQKSTTRLLVLQDNTSTNGQTGINIIIRINAILFFI